ncbi:MAG TPA: ferritin-like domain-containing protein [Mycobacteriales bacterium]|nr:ferritin-like domain-containing protein [Mycobacteriales bacterium]
MTVEDLRPGGWDGAEWSFPLAGDTRFTWSYDVERQRLLNLYQKGKDKQWDAQTRIDWSIELDADNPLGMPVEIVPLWGIPEFEQRLSEPGELTRVRRELARMQISQFLHGEQGAMITGARIVETVPDIDAKFYAATQTMDEARHCETFDKLLRDKMGVEPRPITRPLAELLQQTLSDSRWDMPYLGMQVLIEGLALAAFGGMRDHSTNPLAKQVVAYVMQDEARHVAFGRMALRDAYRELTSAERDEREEFVVEACYLMRDRFRNVEVWDELGYDVQQVLDLTDRTPAVTLFRNRLFTRIVPCIKDIGLWGDRVKAAYADMGVLDYAAANLDGLMADDERTADELDAKRLAARQREVEETITVGAQSS